MVIKNWISGFAKYIFREWLMYLPSRKLRTFFIRKICRNVGNDVFFCMKIDFKGDGNNLSIGASSFINKNVILDARFGKIQIGSNVDIGQDTHIWTTEHDPNDDLHSVKGGDVTIEDHVWISTRVTLLPGITIGKGAVVACGSIVTKDVAPLAIVAGVPAKVIGQRTNQLKYDLSKGIRPYFF
ncbi:acyltransferase [Mucilaginibacter terrae]|uniref:Acetyltransferase-like isoleucine patch superfamily enzyme n=1 Tax=Mucilaginibacter terrae TaxID=1955052 RepID=A0ABU3GPQ2_9SPHI|nr:acyltransferase [Mucilaginibacter terrae]MDT3401763.1 acetyltransferase-like isoleucine patch superfamily enzyme [Mucilaginibacter terrae]